MACRIASVQILLTVEYICMCMYNYSSSSISSISSS